MNTFLKYHLLPLITVLIISVSHLNGQLNINNDPLIDATEFNQDTLGIVIYSPSLLNSFAPKIDLNIGTPDEWEKNGRRFQSYINPEPSWFLIYYAGTKSYWFGPYTNSNNLSVANSKMLQLFWDNEALANSKYVDFSIVKFEANKTVNFKKGFERMFGSYGVDEIEEKREQLETIEVLTKELLKNTNLPLDNLRVDTNEKLKKAVERNNNEVKKIDELIKLLTHDEAGKQLLKQLKGKASGLKNGNVGGSTNSKQGRDEKGNSSGKVGNGKKGWFPVDIAISRWLATVFEVVFQQLLPPPLDQLTKQAAVLAYQMMPDAINRICSSFAKWQRALTKNIDDALNELTDIASFALQIYQDLRNLHELVTSESFAKILKETSFKDIVGEAVDLGAKYDISALKTLKNFQKYLPSSLNLESISEFGISNLALDFQNELFNDISKFAAEKLIIPELEKICEKNGIPFNGIIVNGLINGKYKGKMEDFYKEIGENLVCRHGQDFIKQEYRANYNNACRHLINGDWKKAVVETQANILSRKLGVEVSDLEGMMNSVFDKNYKEAWRYLDNIGWKNIARNTKFNESALLAMRDAVWSSDTKAFAKNALDVHERLKFPIDGNTLDLLRSKNSKDHLEALKIISSNMISEFTERPVKEYLDGFQEIVEGFKEVSDKSKRDKEKIKQDLAYRIGSDLADNGTIGVKRETSVFLEDDLLKLQSQKLQAKFWQQINEQVSHQSKEKTYMKKLMRL